MKKSFLLFVIIIFTLAISCSTVEYTVKKGLPTYSTHKTFEASYNKVWSATYNVIAVNADIEVAEESSGVIKTDWNFGTSDINIAEYKVDDQKRYKPLRLRYRYIITLKKVTGGVKVHVKSRQEFEELTPESMETPSDSWVSTKSSTARENALLEAIKTELRKY